MKSTLLPEVPKVELEVVRDHTGEPGESFLRVRRLELVTVRQGKRSATFRYDVLDRRALDACIMIAHYVEGGVHQVLLRSAVRPPLAYRSLPPECPFGLWEIPAGLIEPDETPRAAAARELAEELGLHVDESLLLPLGSWTAPAPGFIGEMHHFFHVAIDPLTRKAPAGDGSPLEEDASIVSVPLATALEACRRGEIRDAKTELGLRRLKEVVG